MKLSAFIAGLLILQPHHDSDGFHIGAEHDQFYAYATDTPLNPEEVRQMRELGWFQPDTEPEIYDPHDGWSAFT